ncbi:MAG TPA: DUF5305 family protein [Thermoplasmata archaeon]|nr:DUF5305 family protein [Thermoplasmata archaeon]
MKVRTVLLVVLLLGAVVSVYFLVRADTQPRGLTTTSTALSGNATLTFDFNATLLPNTLYNSTHVGPAQTTTLFPALVRSLNLSYTFALNVTPPSSTALIAHEALVASTAAWNDTLVPSSGETTTFSDVPSLSVAQHLTLNLTSANQRFSTIANETKYSPSSITIGYYADIFYVVSHGGVQSGHLLSTSFNLTYTNVLLTTGNRTFSQPWTYNVSSVGPNPSYGPDLDAAGAITAAVFLGIGVLAYLSIFPPARLSARPKSEEAELDAILGPYRDAVAETLSLPHKENIVVMKEWMDVVRAADMLAKPILHLKSEVEGRTRHIFYVVDGAIQYVYLHNVLAPESTPSGTARDGPSPRSPGPKDP